MYSLVGRPKIGEKQPGRGTVQICHGRADFSRSSASSTILGITQGTCRKVSMFVVCR